MCLQIGSPCSLSLAFTSASSVGTTMALAYAKKLVYGSIIDPGNRNFTCFFSFLKLCQ